MNVQVFNHEQDAKDEFVEYNQKLFDSSQKANIYGNVLMPALGNIGNTMYVVVGHVGGVSDPGTDAEYPLRAIPMSSLSASSCPSWVWSATSLRPRQMLMQVPMIALGMAGAGRVFALSSPGDLRRITGYVTSKPENSTARSNPLRGTHVTRGVTPQGGRHSHLTRACANSSWRATSPTTVERRPAMTSPGKLLARRSLSMGAGKTMIT